MKLYNLAGWLLMGALLLGLGQLRFEPEPMRFGAVAVDTVTYGDARIVYKLSTDTSRNINGDLRRIPDLTAAPTGARWRVLWKSNGDSVMLVTGDTFALSPTDSATAASVASSWGVSDPYDVSLAWHVPPDSQPDPLTGTNVVAVYDTLRHSWDAVSDSVRIHSGLDAGGQEDTVYVAGNSTPYDRVVTTIPGDYYSCGNSYTTQAEADYSDNRCDGVAIDTAAPGGSPSYPNEPAGMTTVALQDWTNASVSSPAVEADFTNPTTGVGSVRTNTLSRMEIVSDGTAPAGSGKVMRGKFPDGMQDGVSPWRFDLWGPAFDQSGGTHQYDELYISQWFKSEGSDFDQQNILTKTFYLAHGDLAQQNRGNLWMVSTDYGTCNALVTSFYPQYRTNTFFTNDARTLDKQQGPSITVGSWHQIEIYLKINDTGSANGVFKVWIDGTQTHDYSDVGYRSAGDNRSWYHFQFTPVWGGNSGCVRTRDDYWRIAEVYISGVS